MKKKFERLWRRAAMLFAPYLYKIWAATLRYEEIGREAIEELNAERKVMIICLWHGEIFTLLGAKRKLRLTPIISQSKDGELLSKSLIRMGFKVIRGSSSRGGAEALRGIVRVMRRDAENPCVTMDGPRGPAHKIKDGVFFMARLGQGLLVPTRVYCHRAIRLKSWDSHLIPLPFSRVRVVFAAPYALEAEKLDEDSLRRERERLQRKMSSLNQHSYDNSENNVPLDGLEKLQLGAMRLGIAFLRFLGLRGIRLIGNILGFLTWHCVPGRRRQALDSITRHLQVNAAEARRIGKASFKNNFISFLEAGLVQKFRLSNNPNLLPTNQAFERLRIEERPVVAATAHLGGWELMAGILPDVKTAYPQAVVVRKQKNRAANELIFQMRGSAGGEVVGHSNAAPVVTRILRQNGITAFLVDHNSRRRDATFLPFLGEKAAVNVGPAMLALRAKAMLYPIFLIRRPGCRYELITYDPLDTASLEGSIAERTRQIAEFYTRAVEEMVRKHPEQWLWMHERWKTKWKADKKSKV